MLFSMIDTYIHTDGALYLCFYFVPVFAFFVKAWEYRPREQYFWSSWGALQKPLVLVWFGAENNRTFKRDLMQVDKKLYFFLIMLIYNYRTAGRRLDRKQRRENGDPSCLGHRNNWKLYSSSFSCFVKI